MQLSLEGNAIVPHSSFGQEAKDTKSNWGCSLGGSQAENIITPVEFIQKIESKILLYQKDLLDF